MIWKWLIGNLDSHFKVSWFMSPIYLFLFGQTTSRTRYSRVKKMTTKLSMRSMTRTMRGKSTRPFSSFWSSSAVEMMKVTVEITTSQEVWLDFGLFQLMLLLKYYLKLIPWRGRRERGLERVCLSKDILSYSTARTATGINTVIPETLKKK